MKTQGSYANSAIVYADSTSATLSAFTLSGANRMLCVSVSRNFTDGQPVTMTVGGVAMTVVDAIDTGNRARTYYLGEADLPANGDADIVATYSVSNDIILAAVLITGVKDQAPEASTLVGSAVGGTSFSSTGDDPTGLDISTVTAKAIVVAFASKRFSEDITFTGDLTEREQVLDTASGWALSFIAGPASGQVDFGGTWSTSRDHTEGILIFESADAPAIVSIPTPTIKKPWTRKPPVGTKIDRSNPFVKDMFFFCALDRPGDQVNLIDGAIGVQDISGAARTQLKTTPYGVTQDFEMAANEAEWSGYNWGDRPEYRVTELTIITRVRPETEVHSGGSRIVSKQTGTADDYAIYWGSSRDVWRNRINGSDDTLDPVDHTLLNNILFDIALSVNTNNQYNYAWEVELGDKMTRDQNASGATINQNGGDLCIGIRGNSQERMFDGEIHYVAMWNKWRDQDFITAFRKNPWQIFEPRTIYPIEAPDRNLVVF